jgi:uncharacterized protein (TIRG00374 family)
MVLGVMSPPAPEVRLRSRVFTLVTLLLSLACLGWALHGIGWSELWEDIRELEWKWVVLAVAAELVVYQMQGWRWGLILLPVGPVGGWNPARAIFIGQLLPMRAGELIRSFLLARWSKIPTSVTLASVAIERIFDGVLLISGLFLSLRYIHRFPLTRVQARAIGILTTGSISLAALILIGAALLAVAMFWREQTLDILLDARLFGWAHVFIEDLHRIGHSRSLYFSAFLSIPYLLLQIVPIYAIMRAYELNEASWSRAAVLMVLLRLGAVLPQAPGNVGLYQLLSALGLTLFGVQGAMARRFAEILWGIVTLPVLLVGFAASVATGAKMGEIHREAQAEMRARQDELSRT